MTYPLNFKLNDAKIIDYFEFVIGGNEVDENKPSGEIYKKAIETLGTYKNIIIEDSPTGIQSGKDSGNFVIAIDRGMFTHDQLSEAELVVDKLNPEEIKTLFKNYVKKKRKTNLNKTLPFRCWCPNWS